MASTGLYAPTIDTSMPAFVATGEAYCRVYFSLSKFSSSTAAIKSVHISVVKQSSGQSVVNKTDNPENGRFRSSGVIILNGAPKLVEDTYNYCYVDILNEDIKSGDDIGWKAGWIYKIQVRLSELEYPKNNTTSQAVWMSLNASSFSEWSTYCMVKAIGQPQIKISEFEFDSSQSTTNREEEINLFISTLDFNATYSNAEDVSETLYSYNLCLYNSTGNKVIEQTEELFTNQYYTPNQMTHTLKTSLQDDTKYQLVLTFTTINKYTKSYTFNLSIAHDTLDRTTVSAVTAENIKDIPDDSFVARYKDFFSLVDEEEEGRIAIKLYSRNKAAYNGNICIRRSSSKDNYSTWEDIKIIPCLNKIINELPVYYDNTIESGVWYKYAVQTIDENGDRGIMNPSDPEDITPLLRDFKFSYLIGEGGQQLTLRYNNTMASYTYNYSESKTDTIGGKYPFITRNGNMKYRSFPINGLISFNMDENGLFITEKEIYCNEDTGKPYQDVINSYTDRRKNEQISVYDFKREYDFRERVLAFLQDGKPKLFKSATEGNIIVRLMTVAAQPNQTTNRMIASFTSTAYEVAEATVENFVKYGFYSVGTAATAFRSYYTKIGQLEIDMVPGENLLEKIWEKYNHSEENMAGTKKTLNKVHHLSIEFTDAPLQVYTNAEELVLGNNFLYNNSVITVREGFGRAYFFDENITFTGKSKKGSYYGDSLLILGSASGQIYDENGELKNTIHVSANFLYDICEEPYTEKVVAKKVLHRNIGQLYETCEPGTNLYRELYYKMYYEWETEFRRLSRVTWTCIEANPGAVFRIIDTTDDTTTQNAAATYFDINQTGVLNLEGLGQISGLYYLGMRKADGTIDRTVPCDVIVDCLYRTLEGTYKGSN